MQGLQQEVARRQMAVLDRTSASPDLPQTMHDRQASLRCGHSLQHVLWLEVAGDVPFLLVCQTGSDRQVAVKLF